VRLESAPSATPTATPAAPARHDGGGGLWPAILGAAVTAAFSGGITGVVLGGFADLATSRPSAKQDAEILNSALLLEYVQAAFYAEGLRRAGLSGELPTYARPPPSSRTSASPPTTRRRPT
jgi:hypothetical protein